ncbi:hypothetical protein ACFQS2_03165 [Brachybacterium sp. GCM10030267]|uniref:hypothetical protein n=1 Tax=Brachybacterium sp. GCM10030267 TaxID=3273381 RepID=UPI00361562F2
MHIPTRRAALLTGGTLGVLALSACSAVPGLPGTGGRGSQAGQDGLDLAAALDVVDPASLRVETPVEQGVDFVVQIVRPAATVDALASAEENMQLAMLSLANPVVLQQLDEESDSYEHARLMSVERAREVPVSIRTFLTEVSAMEASDGGGVLAGGPEDTLRELTIWTDAEGVTEGITAQLEDEQDAEPEGEALTVPPPEGWLSSVRRVVPTDDGDLVFTTLDEAPELRTGTGLTGEIEKLDALIDALETDELSLPDAHIVSVPLGARPIRGADAAEMTSLLCASWLTGDRENPQRTRVAVHASTGAHLVVEALQEAAERTEREGLLPAPDSIEREGSVVTCDFVPTAVGGESAAAPDALSAVLTLHQGFAQNGAPGGVIY